MKNFNPEKMLYDVSVLIQKRLEIDNLRECDCINKVTGRWHICWFKKKLCCYPQQHTGEKHTVFCNVTADEAVNGFPPKKWNAIGEALARFFKGRQ